MFLEIAGAEVMITQVMLWCMLTKYGEGKPQAIINGGLRGSKIGSNGRSRRVTTRPVKALDKNLKLNQALWVLTQEMGKLAKEIA